MQVQIEAYHARRRLFAEFGAERFLNYLLACNAFEREAETPLRLNTEAEGFNILLHTAASADVDGLPSTACEFAGLNAANTVDLSILLTPS